MIYCWTEEKLKKIFFGKNVDSICLTVNMDNATYVRVWPNGPPDSIIGWDGAVAAAPMGLTDGCIVSA